LDFASAILTRSSMPREAGGEDGKRKNGNRWDGTILFQNILLTERHIRKWECAASDPKDGTLM
jgi:hypothetical protein